MTATANELLRAALRLDPDEREELARELLASLPADDASPADDAIAVEDDELRTEVIRRARDVRDGQVALLDGPSSLRALRDRRQAR